MTHDRHRLMLLVEDSEAERAALAATARRLGFQVAAAPDATEGRRLLAEQRPDLVLCDYEIPGGGGFSVLDQARMISPRLPFVLMTSHTEPEIRDEAMRRGATIFLSKPLSLTKVDAAIRQALVAGRTTEGLPGRSTTRQRDEPASADSEPRLGA